ncbi:DUF4123 domain-containing protein [Polyangium spumosum]|uniref:DUF4123 domain-containing protein n=1 Tax=Polyangium spumosum TaxID=889282 RepID=UPI0014796E9F
MTEPRLIVEVRYGKLGGTKRAVEAGRALRVGRTELADLVVGHDGQMSGTHFELQWDGASCLLRDLQSQGGTRLGGQVTTQGEVPHGGWIQAGETDFLVYVEGRTKPPRRKLARSPEEEAARVSAAREACELLRAEAAKVPLYAIVDGARDRHILEVIREHVEPHQSLYDGLQGETLEDVAPYLVGPFRKDSALLDRLLAEGFGNRWGMFLTSYDKFVEVRRHFRRFLMVTLESTNEKVYFRFYDPGVLRVFWPTCSPSQCQEFSAGMEELFVEEEDLSLSALVRPH